MADINVDVNLPSAISVDITSPTQALATNISIPGPQGPTGPRGFSPLINGITGESILFSGKDGIIISTDQSIDTIFVSGNSGHFQSAVNSLTTNLNNTGTNLNTSINSLSGLFTGYTGSLDATYATDSQLNSTGNTLNIKIDNLSGYVDTQDSNISNNLASTGSSLLSNINTLSSNLNSTGSNLNDKINSLSGTLTGNYLTTNSASSTYATITNLNSTGSTLNSSISSLSGTLTSNYATIINLASTGLNLQNQINNLDNVYATDASVTSVANNLASTGNALETKIGSLSGTLTSSYATISNLALTGSNLNTKIDNFSGTYQNFVDNLDASYATDSQLQNTGSTLSQNINSLSGTLTGNYYLKSNPSGFITGVDLSSYLTSSTASSTYATITNLASTGSALNSNINSLSGLFTGYTGTLDATYASDLQLSNTGITLNNTINSLSGTLTGNYVTKSNGEFTNRPTVNGTGVLLSGEAAALPSTIVYTTGDQNISGNKTFSNNIYVSGTGYFKDINISNLSELVLSGTKITIDGNSGVYSSTNIYISGNPVLTGVDLSSYATITNLASTGSTLQGNINTLTNNLNSTGNTLDNKIGSLSGTLTSTYATISNLASTGSTLNTKINDLSGYVNTQDNSISNNLISTGNTLQNSINSLSGSSVLLYGNQSVGGIKTFRDNVYINNLFVTGTETIVSTNNFNVQSPYVLLNLTGGAVDGGIFFVTGNGLTGINDSGPIIGFDHSNKFKFGISTRNSDLSTLPDIASVQDIIAYSGVANNTFSTITNLASTGNTLDQKINSLSGTLTSTYATISNLSSTGSTLQSNINTVASNLITTGNTLQSNINTVSSNLISTGNTLEGKISSLSGTLTSNYATITNLASTGSTLVTNLASTGSTLTSNLASTGSTLNSSINSLSGTLTSNYATIINLASTGSTLNSNINSLSGTLTSTYATITNLANTGSTLQTNINNLSGYINSSSSNIVFTTGNQSVAGNKTLTSKLNITVGTSNDSALKVGTLEFQPYAVNNAWFGDNTYYSGGFYRREAGYAGAFYFQGAEGQFRFADTDDAGTSYSPVVQLKTHLDGRFGVGSNISTATSDFTNSNFFVDSSFEGGRVGIGTISPTQKLEVNGNIKFGEPGTASAILYMYDSPNDAYHTASWTDSELQLTQTTDSSNLTIGFSQQGNTLVSNGSYLKLPTGKNDFIAMDAEVVHRTGNETISGIKTFIGNHNISGNTTVSGSINISGNYDLYSEIENAKKLAIAYAIAL